MSAAMMLRCDRFFDLLAQEALDEATAAMLRLVAIGLRIVGPLGTEAGIVRAALGHLTATGEDAARYALEGG